MHEIFKILEELTEKLSISKMEARETINMAGAPTPVKIEVIANPEERHVALCISYLNNWCSLKQVFNFYFRDFTADLRARATVVCPTMQRVYDFEEKLPQRKDRFELYIENTPIHRQLDFLAQLLRKESLERRLYQSHPSISKG